MLEKIASFTINHDTLTPGLYVSRIDGDCVTYDLRCKWPNRGDYLPQAALHTIEHLVATYVRSTGRYPEDVSSDQVVYFGPMGCRTGFYLIVRDAVSRQQVIELVKAAFAFAASFEGDIPGAKQIECGNYLEHDLPGAKAEAAAYAAVLANCTPETMAYPD
ncbi:MAG: S-ribosylhomocysteine lyase [Clostridiales bacterium]|nr:S-ribosylhomocysteine lyase [Clostridiales bacterium]